MSAWHDSTNELGKKRKRKRIKEEIGQPAKQKREKGRINKWGHWVEKGREDQEKKRLFARASQSATLSGRKRCLSLSIPPLSLVIHLVNGRSLSMRCFCVQEKREEGLVWFSVGDGGKRETFLTTSIAYFSVHTQERGQDSNCLEERERKRGGKKSRVAAGQRRDRRKVERYCWLLLLAAAIGREGRGKKKYHKKRGAFAFQRSPVVPLWVNKAGRQRKGGRESDRPKKKSESEVVREKVQ